MFLHKVISDILRDSKKFQTFDKCIRLALPIFIFTLYESFVSLSTRSVKTVELTFGKETSSILQNDEVVQLEMTRDLVRSLVQDLGLCENEASGIPLNSQKTCPYIRTQIFFVPSTLAECPLSK
jgi:hypothetical protein